MSWTQAAEPRCDAATACRPVARVIVGKARDLGGFAVRRVLPAAEQRSLGPFVFVDEMGPADFAPGEGVDVRPHPHIGLATVTTLFDGEILHRDSLGVAQAIRPGAINWMTAGRGIVHSERTGPATRAAGHRLHGLQIWLALPPDHEETAPAFHHHPADTLPVHRDGGLEARVLVGAAFGLRSPVATFTDTLYVDVRLAAGAAFDVPPAAERGAYLVSGAVLVDGERFEPGRLLVFSNDAPVRLEATPDGDVRLAILGGAPLDAPRHMFWNFVSSSRDRIERAKDDWRHHRFPIVPGDESERIPLPS